MHLADIHTHILPGVDDGAKTPADALEMLRLAAQSGVRHVILTPHFNLRKTVKKNVVQLGLELLREEVHKAGIDVELYEGHEIMVTSDLNTLLDAGEYCTLNGSRYVLLELTMLHVRPPQEVLDEVFLSGVTPVLAHAERVEKLRGDLSAFAELCACGVIIQINAESVIGTQDRKTAKFVHKLIKHGLVHVIASDCHDVTERPANLAQAARVIEKKFGEAAAKRLCFENPLRIIHNEDLDT